MIRTWRTGYPAFTGMEMRSIYLYLPDRYDTDPDRRYPVLYLFDGQNVFLDGEASAGRSWRLGALLDALKLPLIAVAVECNRADEPARLQEYSPWDLPLPKQAPSDSEADVLQGYGEDTLLWFKEVLKPYIDESCRTLPDATHTFLGGSEWGGLLSIYGLTHFPDTFSRALAFAPAEAACETALLRSLNKSGDLSGTRLFLSWGEGSSLPSSPEKLIKKLRKQGTLITERQLPAGPADAGIWEKEMALALPFLMIE